MATPLQNLHRQWVRSKNTSQENIFCKQLLQSWSSEKAQTIPSNDRNLETKTSNWRCYTSEVQYSCWCSAPDVPLCPSLVWGQELSSQVVSLQLYSELLLPAWTHYIALRVFIRPKGELVHPKIYPFFFFFFFKIIWLSGSYYLPLWMLYHRRAATLTLLLKAKGLQAWPHQSLK